MITTTTAQGSPAKAGTLFERHGWKILSAVILLIGFFGAGDMMNGASDLQSGERVYMTGVTGMTWNELQATRPTVARMIDTIFRTNGATLATVALLSLVICLVPYRKGERWAWYTLWALPLWMALTAYIIATVEKQPGAGTPVPVISGSDLCVISAAVLLLSYRKFFNSTENQEKQK